MQKLQKKSGLFPKEEESLYALCQYIDRIIDGEDVILQALFFLCDYARHKGLNLEMELDALCNKMCAEHRKMEQKQSNVNKDALLAKIFV